MRCWQSAKHGGLPLLAWGSCQGSALLVQQLEQEREQEREREPQQRQGLKRGRELRRGRKPGQDLKSGQELEPGQELVPEQASLQLPEFPSHLWVNHSGQLLS
jgi:hypothetical protein